MDWGRVLEETLLAQWTVSVVSLELFLRSLPMGLLSQFE